MTVWVVLIDPAYEEHSMVTISGVFHSEEEARNRAANLEEEYFVLTQKWDVQ